MRVRLNSIDLVGTSRTVTFAPGLNIITGPIATGKTTLLRLCRALFGSGIDAMPDEVREHVAALAGVLTLNDTDYTVLRPLVTTDDAKVDVAGPNTALRLPALRPRPEAPLTYGQWLLDTLDLPRVDVPSDPRKPESAPTPVSINDYFLYCILRQKEIDRSIFSHHDYFKNIKRRYVFQILYGLYDVGIANLQEELRDIDSRLRVLQGETGSFRSFLSDTPWENRAALERSLAKAQDKLKAIEQSSADISTRSREGSGAQELQVSIAALDTEMASYEEERTRESESVEQLTRLVAQLETQNSRLTKAIVARGVLVDYDFILCPRCGASVDPVRTETEECYLCLQDPKRQVSREDLIREQARLDAQVVETRELIDMRRERVEEYRRRIAKARAAREEQSQQLDYLLRTFVSQSAREIEQIAAERAEVRQQIKRYRDYLKLYARMDDAVKEIAQLENEKGRTRAEIVAAESRQTEAESRIQVLENLFERILRHFRAPLFGASVNATIDRTNYLPVVNGRPFERIHSLGLNVIINVAHALAHHLTAMRLSLPLPQILLIDGLTSNIGHEGLDQERVNAIYGYLIALSGKIGSELQIIVADNSVPEQARKFVRLELSDGDRLIPIPPEAHRPEAAEADDGWYFDDQAE